MSKQGENRTGDTTQDGAAQVLAAARQAHGYAHRRRFGLPGTEPFEVRRPVWRGYAAEIVALGALLLSLGGDVQAAALALLVALLVGAPRAWTWSHDRVSGAGWLLGLALLVAGEVAWLSGGTAHNSLQAKSPGAAAVLITVCGFVALGGFFRRWGTAGNVFATSRAVAEGDPDATRISREAAEKEGWRPPGS